MPGGAHFPGRPPIDSYGNGGFRFAEMSHCGSLLFLPSGVWGWPPTSVEALDLDDFRRVFANDIHLEFVLLGCGQQLVIPPAEITEAFSNHGLGLEPMGTGAAARTYNILLAEGRLVGAALIAVD